ncbi:outer membrane beta-barrel protein [Fimbriimonas ginsengisoli]|uniref:Outer membrane protein beta-barrel domain-containing protein n=1 Tax=Fimbriimonas ginsengisoli Gsoil 348 TaxID=661478 RepID=A0A068NP86_FIMGI|nr:outer membrane beta-barrel protein [Fimbriimonas ginsengisoli]AIE85373.1 hypothetical protein OP10G_2005 [Fimbriimonas ginsengisoli Gsoil 348]
MKKIQLSVIVVASLGLSALAAAETGKGRPFKVELGAYFPSFSEAGISKKTGATFAFGYNFKNENSDAKMPVQLGLELRGSSFKASDATDEATITISQFLANADLSSPDGKLFYGVHLGFGKGSASSGNVTVSDDKTRFVYGAHVGYNFSPTVYGIAHYTTASQEVYRGFSVAVGYRF